MNLGHGRPVPKPQSPGSDAWPTNHHNSGAFDLPVSTMTPEARDILSRADHRGALSSDDQRALAKQLGIGVNSLPAQMRGGLLGIFLGE